MFQVVDASPCGVVCDSTLDLLKNSGVIKVSTRSFIVSSVLVRSKEDDHACRIFMRRPHGTSKDDDEYLFACIHSERLGVDVRIAATDDRLFYLNHDDGILMECVIDEMIEFERRDFPCVTPTFVDVVSFVKHGMDVVIALNWRGNCMFISKDGGVTFIECFGPINPTNRKRSVVHVTGDQTVHLVSSGMHFTNAPTDELHIWTRFSNDAYKPAGCGIPCHCVVHELNEEEDGTLYALIEGREIEIESGLAPEYNCVRIHDTKPNCHAMRFRLSGVTGRWERQDGFWCPVKFMCYTEHLKEADPDDPIPYDLMAGLVRSGVSFDQLTEKYVEWDMDSYHLHRVLYMLVKSRDIEACARLLKWADSVGTAREFVLDAYPMCVNIAVCSQDVDGIMCLWRMGFTDWASCIGSFVVEFARAHKHNHPYRHVACYDWVMSTDGVLNVVIATKLRLERAAQLRHMTVGDVIAEERMHTSLIRRIFNRKFKAIVDSGLIQEDLKSAGPLPELNVMLAARSDGWNQAREACTSYRRNIGFMVPTSTRLKLKEAITDIMGPQNRLVVRSVFVEEELEKFGADHVFTKTNFPRDGIHFCDEYTLYTWVAWAKIYGRVDVKWE